MQDLKNIHGLRLRDVRRGKVMQPTISTEQITAIERLIELSNPDPVMARELIAEFREQLEEEADGIWDGSDLMWLFKDVTEWNSGFFTSCQDTSSFIECMDMLCAARGILIDWEVTDPMDDDFLADTSIPELMCKACELLNRAGLTLWNWDAGEQYYGGWIAAKKNDSEILAIAEHLQTSFRAGHSIR